MARHRNSLSNFEANLFAVIFRLTTIAAVIVGLSEGCSKPTPPPVILPPALSIVQFDSLMVLGAGRYHQLSVRAYPVEITQNRQMFAAISGPIVGSHFRLYDDGGFGRWFDSAGFADTLSGDAAPSDGIFTRKINTGFTISPGRYLMKIYLTGMPPPDTLSVNLAVVENRAPVIIGHSIPDSLPSGIQLMFQAVVADPDGNADVAGVYLNLYYTRDPRSEYKTFPFQRQEADSLWRWESVAVLAAGLGTGSYPALIKATDYIGRRANVWTTTELQDIWLENAPPLVNAVAGPDTLWFTAGDTTTQYFHYLVDVDDPQTAGDLRQLDLVLIRPDQTRWTNTYFDDGQGIDTTAQDGRFTVGFSANSSNRMGTFFLEWTGVDRAGQQSRSVTTPLVFLLRGGAPGRSSNSAPGAGETFTQLVNPF